MTGNILIRPSVQKRFDSFMEHGRVLFFSAPCGFGKTSLADALLHGRNVLRLNAGALGCLMAFRYEEVTPPLPRGDGLRILRLICVGKSGAKFRAALDSKLPPVKTRMSHILSKLGVSRRSKEKTVAKKLRLISEG